MPAQPGDDAGALGDEVFTMVDQQPDLPLDAIEAGDRQVRLPQRGPRHRQGVNRIGFAVAARRVTHMRHQLRRYPHHRLARGDQVAFEPPCHVPAILDRPQPLLGQTDRPLEQSQVILCRGTNSFHKSLSTHRVESDRGMAALVRVDSDDHHGTRLPPSWVARTGRSAYPNGADATLLLSQIGRSSGVDQPH